MCSLFELLNRYMIHDYMVLVEMLTVEKEHLRVLSFSPLWACQPTDVWSRKGHSQHSKSQRANKEQGEQYLCGCSLD